MADSKLIYDLSKCQEVFIYELSNYIRCYFGVIPILKDKTKLVIDSSTKSTDIKYEIEYFLEADKQYIVSLKPFSKPVFKKKDVKMYISTKNHVLLSIVFEDSILYIYGGHQNINQFFNFITSCQNKADLKTCPLSIDEINDLKRECETINLDCFKFDDPKSQWLFYYLIMNIVDEFDEFNMNDLKSVLPNEIETEESEHQPKTLQDEPKDSKYRTIIIDGSNVAWDHGEGKFSPKGIKLCVDYFVNRGHRYVYALVPRHRQPLIESQFDKSDREKYLKYTPSRLINNVRQTPYDDRLILDAAIKTEGVVVSNDQYRDLINIDDKYRELISNRLIPYTFIGDHLILPNDPMGRSGPTLTALLEQNTTIEEPSKFVDLNLPLNIQNNSRHSRHKSPNVKQQHHHNQLLQQKHKQNQLLTQQELRNRHNIHNHNPHNAKFLRSHKKDNPQNQQREHRLTSKLPEFWGGEHRKIYKEILSVLPGMESTIVAVMSANPNVVDANVIVDLIMTVQPKSTK